MNATTAQHEVSILERLLTSADSPQAILSIRFPVQDEERMRELMDKNNRGTISDDEKAEMEAFRRIGSVLAIAQAKARLQLKGDAQEPNGT